MSSIKLLLFTLVICILEYANAQYLPLIIKPATIPLQLLDIVPTNIFFQNNNVPTREGYRFNSKPSDGSYHKKAGMDLNPRTEKKKLDVMIANRNIYEHIGAAITYTTGSNDTQKDRGIGLKCLRSCVG